MTINATVTNILRQGARYVHHAGGTVVLQPGETRELTFLTDDDGEKGHNQIANVPDGIKVGGRDILAASLDGMDDDGLRAYLDRRDGKAPSKNLNRDKLLEMALATPKAPEPAPVTGKDGKDAGNGPAGDTDPKTGLAKPKTA